jgi:5-methylcytosine-specific restriction endonuclease McrA
VAGRTCRICGRDAVRGRSRCSDHGPVTPTTAAQGYGADHQARVATLLRTTPEVCALCGRGSDPGDPWVADHIIPRSLGGDNRQSNYQRVHRSCNVRKGGANRRR